MKNRTVFLTVGILIFIVFIIAFSLMNTENTPEYLTIIDAKPNELFSEGMFTSLGVINEFFNALNDGDAIKLNEQYSPNYFETNDMKIGYTEFTPQKITEVKVKLLDQSTENEKFYEVIFTIVDNASPPFLIAGNGEKTYFFNLIKEKGNWKIKNINTSP